MASCPGLRDPGGHSMTRGYTVGVIGVGAVGQTAAALLAVEPWCTRLLVTSRTSEAARGLVTDLEDARQLTGGARTFTATRADMGDADALVVCPRATFTNTRTADVRMAGLAANAPTIAEWAEVLTGYPGVVVMVTNPVDVLARYFAELSRTRQVYGTGSATDTARYRLALAHHHRVSVDTVEGYVIGEHGDSAVICASSTTINGRPATVPLDVVTAELRDRPRRINTGIGRVRNGPAAAVVSALRKLLAVEDGTDVLSVNRGGVWLGIRLQITAGQPAVTPLTLNERETAQFIAARAKLGAAYRTINREGASQC
ncbi:lactate/malate family dehydrogenase [Streptomyces sp. Marseille-Q5077]|uniref:lactate/malate family dehydrogenase n=1 Tax=Streptomyces sp. Marseille-Q5077 TaxID=3418995 RepID=UPI003D08F2D4